MSTIHGVIAASILGGLGSGPVDPPKVAKTSKYVVAQQRKPLVSKISKYVIVKATS